VLDILAFRRPQESTTTTSTILKRKIA